MYESLTQYTDKLSAEEPGKWIVDNKNEGTPEHPIQFPFVLYGETVRNLEQAIYEFVESHEELGLRGYGEILEKNGIKWDMNSMSDADVSSLDGVVVMALLLGAVRAERFCDGALLHFVENGCVLRWIQRLKELDNN